MITLSKKVITLSVLVLLATGVYAGTPQGVHGGRTERVKPLLIGDEYVNKTILFVSENCELLIPEERNIDGIEGKIYCSFSVDTTGKVVSAWITKGIVYWLDRAVVEAIVKLPSWDGYFHNNNRKPVRHDIVFTFNSRKGIGYTDINSVAKNQQNQMVDKITEEKRKESEEQKARTEQWAEFRKENITETVTAEQKKALRGQDVGLILENPAGNELKKLQKKVGITVSAVIE